MIRGQRTCCAVAPAARGAALLLALGLALSGGCGNISRDREKGLGLVESEQFELAIPLLERVVEKEPEDVEARSALALALTQLGKSNAAIQEWLRVLKQQPDWAEAHYWLGNAYVGAERESDAIREWVRAVEADSTQLDAQYNLGFAYVRKGLNPLAIEQWSQLLRIDPTHLPARMNRGRLFVTQGSLKEALEDFLVAVAIDSDVAINWLSLGETYFMMGDSANAVAAIDTFLAKQRGADEMLERARTLRGRIVAGEEPPEVEKSPLALWPSPRKPPPAE